MHAGNPAAMSLATLLQWATAHHPRPWRIDADTAPENEDVTVLVVEDARGLPVTMFDLDKRLVARLIVEGVNALHTET